MVNVNVKITGLEALQRKLGYPVLAAPAMQEALEKIANRPLRVAKKARGSVGIKNNVVTVHKKSGEAFVVSSTKNNPRRKGTAWLRYNIAAIKAMTPNQLRAAARRIEAEFAR